MTLPVVLAGAGAVSNILSGLFGGGTKNALPDWLLNELQKASTADYSGFVPDAGAFQAETNQNIKNILAQLPVAQENFNAQAASRGVFTGGEALTHLYSDAYAPISRNAMTAALQGQTQFAQLKQSGLVAAANARLNALQLATQGFGMKQPTQGARFWNAIGQVGNTATEFGLNQWGADLQNSRDYSQLMQLLPLLQSLLGGNLDLTKLMALAGQN